MTDDQTTPMNLDELQYTLTYLYDPIQLQKSPLARRIADESEKMPASALRDLIIEAIEALRPEDFVPTHSNIARYYHLLYQRYVEQYSQQEVASDLGLSVRQLRRLEKAALSLLAENLITNYPAFADDLSLSPPAMYGDDSIGEEMTTPSRQAELAWSRKTIPTEAVDAGELVNFVLRMLTPLAATIGVMLEADIQERLPHLEVRAVPVRQALLSIFGAAARGASGGKLRVEVRSQDEWILIEVAATDQKGRVLVCNRHDSESLRMAGELVALSGGRMVNAPTGPEHLPATIQVILPAVPRITVLAIDDNPDTLQLLLRYTEGTRYQLVGIHDPHRLIALAQELMPHIIVLDIMLPGIDGWELLGRLSTHPVLNNIPVIIATILPQEQLASALGAAAFIRKPVGRDVFLRTLDMQVGALRR